MTSTRSDDHQADENDRPEGTDADVDVAAGADDQPTIADDAVVIDPAARDRLPGWWPLAAVLAVAVVVLLGAGLWLTSSSSGETETAGQIGARVEPTIASAGNLNGLATDIGSRLTRLGFDGVVVGVSDSRVSLSGTVSSEQDLSTLRDAVLDSASPDLIDMSGVEVIGGGYGDPAAVPGQQAPPPGARPPGAPPPGSPPPGFVPPTAEQQDNLQAELDRVLTETPLVFESGSTSLNELQLEVLDSTIISLLEAHPGVPVRLVGYTDEAGDEFNNSLLSFDRANAVRDYLISRGVPEFILRVEGRGEDGASGDAGADRRVELEVIRTP